MEKGDSYPMLSTGAISDVSHEEATPGQLPAVHDEQKRENPRVRRVIYPRLVLCTAGQAHAQPIGVV